jgi:hypothetical protein
MPPLPPTQIITMKTFVSRLFPRTPAKAATKPPGSGGRDNPLTIEDGSENAMRRQLVQVLLRDLLRNSGIPAEWIDSRMLLVSSRSRGHGMYVRLVVKHWDSRFMDYAYAFEQNLLADIERFEPNSAKWLHGISWQFDLADRCPFTSLPPKAYWSEPDSLSPAAEAAMAAVPAAPSDGAVIGASAEAAQTPVVQENDPASDLQRLFAIRDQEIARQSLQGLPSAVYEKTQPAPL